MFFLSFSGLYFFVVWQIDYLINYGKVPHNSIATAQLCHKLDIVSFILALEELVKVGEAFV